MYTNLESQTRSVEEKRDASKKNVKIHRKQLIRNFRAVAIVILFLILAVALSLTYQTSELFWPLLKGSVILVIVGFVAMKFNDGTEKIERN
jgi:hypothetical protein